MRYTAAAAGFSHTVLLRSDGQAVAFGWNDDGQTDVPPLPAGLYYTTSPMEHVHWRLVTWVALKSGDLGLRRAVDALTERGLRQRVFGFMHR